MRFRYYPALLILLLCSAGKIHAQAFLIEPDKVTHLVGYWTFIPHKLLTGFDLRLQELHSEPQPDTLYVPVPSDWNNYQLSSPEQRAFGSKGFGTFTTWLENLVPGEEYAIRGKIAENAHRIFVGDDAQPLCGAGRVAQNPVEYEAERMHVLCRFTAQASRMRLTIQVANFLHARGGMRYIPAVGKESLIWRDYLIQVNLTIMALAFLLAHLVFTLLSFFRDRRNARSLYMIGMTVSFMVHLLSSDVAIGRELFDFYGFLIQTKLYALIKPFGPAMLALYLSTWLKAGRFMRIVKALSTVLVIWSLFQFIVPLEVSIQFYMFTNYLLIVVSVAIFLLLLYVLWQNRGRDLLLALGCFFLLVAGLLALLRSVHLLQMPDMEFVGLLLFLVLQSGQGIIELFRFRRRKQSLLQESRASLSRLMLLVPHGHLKKVSRGWREPIEPGRFYRTDACIMFLRIEPKDIQTLPIDDIFQLHADLSEEVANYADRSGGVMDRISIGRYILSFNDDPAVALRLAVHLRKQVRIWAEALERFILFRCGIHYGPAVWGIYGSPERWTGGYMGDTVNTAARLETLCARYRTGILLSQDAYFQSMHFDEFLTRMLEPVKLKGKDQHVFLYEVLSGLPDARLELAKEALPSFGRGLQAFVNRDFAKSVDFFERALAIDSADFAAQLYLSRARRLMEQGSDETWNPIEALQKK